MMQRMAPSPQPQPQDAVIDKKYEIVRRQGAKVFAGTTDPAEAEEWLKNMERVLDKIECTSEQKLRYGVSSLEKDALDWWKTITGSKNRPATLTLSKYAPEEVSTDELRRDRFERGLRLEIQEKIEIKPPGYGALPEAALRAEETSIERSSTEAKRKKLTYNLNPTAGQSGAVSFRGSDSQRAGLIQCFQIDTGPTSLGFAGRQDLARSFSGRSTPSYANCGHIVRDCPTWRDNTRGPQTSRLSSVGENSQWAGMSRGRGRGNISTTSTGQGSQPQPQTKVYPITKEQALAAPEVLTSSFSKHQLVSFDLCLYLNGNGKTLLWILSLGDHIRSKDMMLFS
ncbi:UNVERIFIED_CONTAM: hypothetical protein Sindi_0940300 [Sesamum indicum]